ncbi:MAG: hydrogen gas-evolving membrane-bound hydrogenase subunit E [Elusimicrobiota bacterium]|jgi:multisubunit Na+/H+ antiporter MnhB subunit
MIELYTLLGFMIVAALIAIELKDLLSAVVSVSAVGLGLSMVFLILKAPDVAITQLVVEILCLIILIRATIRKDLPFSTSGRWLLNTSITLVFTVIFLTVAWKALAELPKFGYPVPRVSLTYLQEGLAQTGATNLVAAVSMNYRVYDRLGEMTALLAALVGVLTLLRRNGKWITGRVTEEEEE